MNFSSRTSLSALLTTGYGSLDIDFLKMGHRRYVFQLRHYEEVQVRGIDADFQDVILRWGANRTAPTVAFSPTPITPEIL
jgi:hypothetical protein